MYDRNHCQHKRHFIGQPVGQRVEERHRGAVPEHHDGRHGPGRHGPGHQFHRRGHARQPLSCAVHRQPGPGRAHRHQAAPGHGLRLPGWARFSKGSNLAKGLSTAILLYCFGTLSILGPIESALHGDHTYLFTNAILDGITSIVLSSTFGMGIAIAAGVLFCWQGGIFLLANLIAPYLTPELLTEISLVGGVLILSSGLSILNIKQFKTLNLLPALLVPPVAVGLLSLLGI